MQSAAVAHAGRPPARPPQGRATPSRPAPPPPCRAATPGGDVDPLAALGLAPPLLDGDLETLQAAAGVEEVVVAGGGATLTSFGVDADAAAALRSEAGVALVDAGGWTVLRIGGPGALAFLHAQSTADFTGRATPPPVPGQALVTTFTTPAAGCLATGTALVLPDGDGVLLLVGPGGPGGEDAKVGGAAVARRLTLAASLPPAAEAAAVSVVDVTPRCAAFSLLGAGSAAALARLGARAAAELPRGAFTMLGAGPGAAPIFIVAGAGLASVPGFTLLADVDSGGAAGLWSALASTPGVIPAGSALWHAVRVEDGAPAAGAELDGKHTPLEAGLGGGDGGGWVSVAKGCYLGAEALTKVAGARGRLKAELWGLRIAAPPGVRPLPGDAVAVVAGGGAGGGGGRGGPPLGKLTSVAPTLAGGSAASGGGTLALAYLSPARAGDSPDALKAGLRVSVACSSGGGAGGGAATTLAAAVVEALPHADRTKPPLQAAAAASEAAPAAVAAPAGAAAATAAKEEARAAKLAAMKARLDAWQAEQAGGGGG